MSDEDLIEVMMREAARAAPWGVMLLVVLLFAGMWLKQEIKAGIAFASLTVIQNARAAAPGARSCVSMKRKHKIAAKAHADQRERVHASPQH